MKRYVRELGNDVLNRIKGIDIESDQYIKQVNNIIKAHEKGLVTSIESSRQILLVFEKAVDEDFKNLK